MYYDAPYINYKRLHFVDVLHTVDGRLSKLFRTFLNILAVASATAACRFVLPKATRCKFLIAFYVITMGH